MSTESPETTEAAYAPGGPAYADTGLQLITEAITEVLGFTLACINIRRGDIVETVAAIGTASGQTSRGERAAEDLVGRVQPVAQIEEVMAGAEDWGLFKFLPHDAYVEKFGETPGGHWIPNITDHRRDPRAWRPYDFLVAMIRDQAGELVGTVSIDGPVSGRRPGPATRRILERYARQARKAILLYTEREQLTERAHAVEVARAFLREAGTGLTLAEVLAGSQDALVQGLGADALYLEATTADGDTLMHTTDGMEWTPTPLSVRAGLQESEELWTDRTYSVLTRATLPADPKRQSYAEEAFRFLDAADADSALIVPVGADQERLGHFVLLRKAGRNAWTEAEGRLALELGQDLGRFVLTSNMYTHERDLADRLRTADAANSRLIEAVSRELHGPLGALETGLAALVQEVPGQVTWQQQLDGLLARSEQLDAIVASLLLYSRVSDPDTAGEHSLVDLDQLLEEIGEDRERETLDRGIHGTLETSGRSALVLGDRSELRAAIMHLVDNALVYTHRGGQIALRLQENGAEVAVSVVDSGVGIPENEQPHVWTEFYRGSSPALGGMKGAGLGLAIAKQIARRHRGRVTLRSEPGAGTRTTIVLPLAYDA